MSKELTTVIRRHVDRLRALGFGTDRDINAADLVDVINLDFKLLDALSKMEPAEKVKFQFENTDTFGGEANYVWCNRAEFEFDPSINDRQLIRRAKAWAGYTGIRCRVEHIGDSIAIYPRGICQVLFINVVQS